MTLLLIECIKYLEQSVERASAICIGIVERFWECEGGSRSGQHNSLTFDTFLFCQFLLFLRLLVGFFFLLNVVNQSFGHLHNGFEVWIFGENVPCNFFKWGACKQLHSIVNFAHQFFLLNSQITNFTVEKFFSQRWINPLAKGLTLRILGPSVGILFEHRCTVLQKVLGLAKCITNLVVCVQIIHDCLRSGTNGINVNISIVIP
mmetsp:Transcript_3669/g.13958  ORF Transcript_3669/g.13958 Transcript_3669/m.13958 type:complete len:204 (-) Transcript_3669:1443-2054(-)